MKLLTATVFLILTLFLSFNSEASPKLFGKSEERNSDIDEFPKWVKVLDKKTDEMKVYEKSCDEGSKKFYCNIKDWREYLDEQKGKDKVDQLKAINSYANKHKYTLDINNWGITDYWESPGEFLFKNGDCEDYAIIKYFSLKQLGFDVDNLRVVVLMDQNLGIYHSVLAVYQGDDIYILDNQIKNITKDTNILHYNPVYSINEDHWWRHL
jgi:predicted transglutaminase-like cysteine proteinase